MSARALGLVALLAAVPLQGADAVLDNKGFDSKREFASELPFEHVDPLTGNLVLTLPILDLPGNAGFGLDIQAVYNIKVYRNYTSGGAEVDDYGPAGLGFTLHFGRLVDPDNVTPGPVVEMSDGSAHPSYIHPDSNGQHFMTREFWTVDKGVSPPVLRLPNGMRYTFGERVSGVPTYAYATKIEDRFGNQVVINYRATDAGLIDTVVQRFRTGTTTFQERTVTFGYTTVSSRKMISSIQSPRGTWTLVHDLTPAGNERHVVLKELRPPSGTDPSWTFEYYGPLASEPDGPFLLKKLTTPNGGTIEYQYQRQLFNWGSSVAYSPVLEKRTTSGADIAGGIWNYTFESPSFQQPVKATIAAPCRTVEYLSYPLDLSQQGNQSWRVGTLQSKTVKAAGGGGSPLETTSLTWVESVPLSSPLDPGFPHSTALLDTRTVVRDGLTLVTDNDYQPGTFAGGSARNFHDYGQPTRVVESGSLGRTTDLEYDYPSGSYPGFGSFFVGALKKDRVTVGTETFERSFVYTSGFLTEQTLYGITTTFTPTAAGGNVASATDERQHRTSYQNYTWGLPQTIQEPNYSISRVIGSGSTITSETRRGFVTSFTYDGLARVISIDRPLGNDSTVTYTGGRTVENKRGASRLTTTLDGFGRPSLASNATGVKVNTDYDSCGRIVQASLPFVNAADEKRTTFLYDALERVTRRANPEDTDSNQSRVVFAYGSGGTGVRLVTITDELSRQTKQSWKAFGHPDAARLMSVEDAGSGAGGSRQTTSYDYNALGRLTRVDAPQGNDRTWTYNASNQLTAESHPESGSVTYTYYADGLLEKQTDALGETRFGYDGSHRLTSVTRPGGSRNTTIGYDESSNRTSVTRGPVASEFKEYDGNNRPARRVDTIQGRAFTTRYGYDGNDNVSLLTYPSTAKVAYGYDAENRITSVADGGTLQYASAFSHHPSGGVLSFQSGNGVVHHTDFDSNRHWVSRTWTERGAGDLTSTGYGHDKVGNVTSLTDNAFAGSPLALTYDGVDRLKTFGSISSFTYDTMGNRTRHTLSGAATNFQYAPATNRLDSLDQGGPATGFEYDGNGNTKNVLPPGAPPEVYTYDPDNTLATAQLAGTSASYLYDGDQLRKRRTVGAKATYYVHGPGNQVLGEYEVNGSAVTPLREYVYAGSRPIAAVKPAVLTVTPDPLAFAVLRNSGLSAPQNLTILASGQTVPWTAQASAPWISVPGSGTTSTAAVRVNPNGLQVGIHTGTITISAANVLGSPRIVTVMMAVTNTAGLVLLPRPMVFEATEGDVATPLQRLYVFWVGAGAPAQWNATLSAPWVGMSATSGSFPGTVDVTADPTGKRRGTYPAYATVVPSGPTGPSNTRVLPIDLIVRPGPGVECDPADWYCERFDDHELGPIDGQGGWDAVGGEIAPDPRGQGRLLLLDAPSIGDGTINGMVNVTPHPIDGNQISMQIMVHGVGDDQRQVGKMEFFTQPGVAWGKTGRTYGALRFGSKLYLQFGPNVWKVLMERLENDRWYDVRVVYSGGAIVAYVDGQQRAMVKNPLVGPYSTQAFVFTGWDFPGLANVDLLEARAAQGGLVVDPQPLRFTRQLGVGGAPAGPAPKPTGANRSRTASRFHGLPMGFEENRGQAPAEARFVARGRGHGILLTEDSILLTPPSGSSASPVRIRFDNARARAIQAGDPLPGTVNYLLGNDAARWAKNIRRHGRVRYADAYPGIDLEVYVRDREVEYDLVVAPGADPSQVKLSFEGARSVRVDDAGDLVLDTAWGAVRQRKPLVYQEHGGRRTPVAGGYVLAGPQAARFALGEYDASRALVLDPVIQYSTYLGGSATGEFDGQDTITAVNVDADGSLYLAGHTNSVRFVTNDPVRFGPLNNEGLPVAFAAKMSPSGDALEWLTYVGGSSGDTASSIAIDNTLRVMVAGTTGSSDFPTAPAGGVIDATYGGEADGFVFRLSADGSQLEYSTYLGGQGQDGASSIDTIEETGEQVVVGATGSADFPVSGALPGQDTLRGTSDAFLVWLNAAGTAFRYSTFLGGANGDGANAVDVRNAPEGHPQIYVGGATVSIDFPTTPGVVDPDLDTLSSDGFVTRVHIDPNASRTNLAFSYSTYVKASNGSDTVAGIVVDFGRVVHIALPTRPSEVNYSTAFVLGLSDDATHYVYEREIGSDGELHSIALHPDGSLTLAGIAEECNEKDHPGLPCVPFIDALPDSPQVGAYVIKLDPGATTVRWATGLGCTTESSRAYAVTAREDVSYIVGETSCPDFPTVDALQPYLAPPSDGFVTAIRETQVLDRIEFTDIEFRTPESGDGGTPPKAAVTLRRIGTLEMSSSVTVSTSNGSAEAGTDYVSSQQPVTFAPLDEEKTVEVTLINDAVQEPAEFLNVSLGGFVNARPGQLSSVPLWIEDDDGLSRVMTISDSVDPNGPSSWTIDENIPWLGFSQTTGNGRSSVTATATPGARPPGTYVEYFVVTGAPGQADSPQVVEAILVVLP